MNSLSKGGLILAQYIVSAYMDNPNVKAIIVGGSVSRGYADTYSDLEIGVFWAQPPSNDERQIAIERVGGDLWAFNPYRIDPEWLAGEHYGLNELTIDEKLLQGTAMIDAKHFTVSGMEQCLYQFC